MKAHEFFCSVYGIEREREHLKAILSCGDVQHTLLTIETICNEYEKQIATNIYARNQWVRNGSNFILTYHNSNHNNKCVSVTR